MPTPRIKAADQRRASAAPAPVVTVAGRHAPVARARVARLVAAVLAAERARASVSVTFVGPRRIRQLNAAWKRADRPTDVLAFSLPLLDGSRQGDVYICRAVAAGEAKKRGIPLREELLRLVIHGTLHVLGYDHPADAGRVRSPMWQRQERYLACLG